MLQLIVKLCDCNLPNIMSLLPLIGRFILALVIVIWAYRHVNTPEHSIQELQRNCRVAKELLGTINIPLLVVNQVPLSSQRWMIKR